MAVRQVKSHPLPELKTALVANVAKRLAPTDFLSIRVYLGAETTRSMGLGLLGSIPADYILIVFHSLIARWCCQRAFIDQEPRHRGRQPPVRRRF